LAGFISVLATAAFAQPDNKPANAMDLRSAQADLQKSDGVPAGGCMPIGLTARGDLVFPMQCRELIGRERVPLPEGETADIRAAISTGAVREDSSGGEGHSGSGGSGGESQSGSSGSGSSGG